MTELLMSAAIDATLERLISSVVDKLRLLSGVEDEIQRLSRTVDRIRTMLSDAETMRFTSESLKLWLKELKHVAYNAEDTIEEYALELSGSNAQEKIKVRRFSCCSCFQKVKFEHEIGIRIRVIRENMDEILDEGKKFQLPTVALVGKIGTGERPQTYSLVDESETFGRENDKHKIIEMLLASGSGGENLSVISILGMGGLGKTTLAQLVYNDEEVAKHFQTKIWVCVSDDFDVKKLFKATIESIEGRSCDLMQMDRLQTRLRELLDRKRYLLVLDDVWNEDSDLWETFQNPLKCCGDKGSKIVVTSRSRQVATITGATNFHLLEGLDDEDCWSLFAKRAFGRREDIDPNFIKIGREIVKKCKGVPLAVKTLGGLMRFRREASDLSYWLSVRDSEIWNLPEDGSDSIFPALRLSYNHLPAHVKRCFAYCSIFPKDYVFEKETLIQQWIAAGFIPLSTRGPLAEDIGNGYFNNLLWRSFFQDVEKDECGEIEYCKMHDLIHDLAALVAKDECFTFGVAKEEKSTLEQMRYASFLLGLNGCVSSEDLYEAKNLRALVGIPYNMRVNFDKLYSNVRRLRVLIAGGDKIIDLSSIWKLIHLRFLDLSNSSIDTIPTSITSLKNLQTLKLHNTRRLPEDMSNMINLRHLDIRNCDNLTCMPPRIGQLTSLQTLSRFIVGKESGCSIEELQNLQLRGDIRIDELENVGDVDNAKRSKLKDKLLLRSVGFYWSEDKSYDGEANRLDNVEEVLEALQPPENLKRLWVINYSGGSFPKWLMNPLLPYLVDIVLYNCKGCEFLPPLGQLPNLGILILDKMSSVKYIDGTVKGFPSLKTLVLRDMPNLVGWSGIVGIDLFPCLEKLIVDNCNRLTCLPWLSAIRHLELYTSNAAVLGSVGTLTSLSFLGIVGFQELEFLPEGMLQNHTALQSIEISWCPFLKTLPMQGNLLSLETLHIAGCHSLTSFPSEEIQGLTSLLELWIRNCGNLTSLSQNLQYLTSLKKFSISSLPKLVSFPEDLQHLTTLEILSIEYCDSFASLPEWVGNLASLQELRLIRCPRLKCLPTGPDKFSSLQILDIRGCDDLSNRYNQYSGTDWHSIKHIPFVDMNSRPQPHVPRTLMKGWAIGSLVSSGCFFPTHDF